MTYKATYFAAMVLAACACGGCRTYPRTVYSSRLTTYPSATVVTEPAYVAPTVYTPVATGTSAVYVDSYYEPYYDRPYYIGGGVVGAPPPPHHLHSRGQEHGYGKGPIMPPRGAGPARQPTKMPPHAPGKAVSSQISAANHAAASHARAVNSAAMTQARAANSAAAAQARAATQARAAAQVRAASSANHAAAAQARAASSAAAARAQAARSAAARMPHKR